MIHRFTRFARALSHLVTGQYFHSPLRNVRTVTALAASVLTSALLSTASLPAAAQAPTGPQTGLPITELTAGIHVIRAEVANTDETRRIGLMMRKSLPDNNGMLFVFDEADTQCFWMRNTLVPLSIAFIADDGTIVNMADMAPQTDEPHCSEQPVRYALEMAQGWFDTRGVAAGQRLGGISQ